MIALRRGEGRRNQMMSKTGYVMIALRRGEGRRNQLMLKTGYVKIASRLVTVARSCLYLIQT
jgi:hypothetical protein